jgi:predicted metal-binding protein
MKPGCPPNAPVFDQVFDMTKTIYAVFCTFDLGAHVIKMRSRHPGWTEKQLRNMLYWQGTAGKMLRMNIRKFNALYGKDGYFAVMSPEAMGVDVTRTMKNIGIELEWPVVNTVYKIAMAGIPKDPKYARIFVE